MGSPMPVGPRWSPSFTLLAVKEVIKFVHCINGVAFPYVTLSSQTKSLAWVQERKTKVLREKTTA